MVDDSPTGLGGRDRAGAVSHHNRCAHDPASAGRAVGISHADFEYAGGSGGQPERHHLDFRKQERQQSHGPVDRRTANAAGPLRSKKIPMQLRAVFLFACFALAISTTSLDAAHIVWSGLVIAENVPPPN